MVSPGHASKMVNGVRYFKLYDPRKGEHGINHLHMLPNSLIFSYIQPVTDYMSWHCTYCFELLITMVITGLE